MFVVKKADVSKPARKGAGKAAVHDKDVVRTSAVFSVQPCFVFSKIFLSVSALSPLFKTYSYKRPDLYDVTQQVSAVAIVLRIMIRYDTRV